MPESMIKTAVILAAGRGTRMGEITQQTPKPMLNVQGRPLLDHILGRLASVGVERFFIVVGYLHQLIEDHFRNYPLPIEFRLQDPVDGTGSAARLARNFVADQPFLLTFGDILCDPSEYLLCSSTLLDNPGCAAAVAVKAVDDPWQGAAVYEENGILSRILEKPPRGTSTTHWNSAGFYAFQPAILGYLDRLQPSIRREYDLTSALEMMISDGLQLRSSPIAGDWRDVGRPEDLEAVNAGNANSRAV